MQNGWWIFPLEVRWFHDVVCWTYLVLFDFTICVCLVCNDVLVLVWGVGGASGLVKVAASNWLGDFLFDSGLGSGWGVLDMCFGVV